MKINKMRTDHVIDFAAEELKKYLWMMMPGSGNTTIELDPTAQDGFRLGLLEDFGLENEALRPIFADTAGGRQMMEIFVPQETVLLFGGKRRRVLAAVALCSGLGSGAPALVPASLLEEAPQGAVKESVKESNL